MERRFTITLTFLDLFAGIGGFRLGMEAAGHECVGFCEIDKFAKAAYKAIHNTQGELEFGDITKITNEDWAKLRGKVDVICGGFPCQSFSLAGHRRGFEDARGTLFFELARAAQQIQPRLLFLENVKGLLSHDKGRTFGLILHTLDELGYDVEWCVLNSKDFGVPQNRERVFIIGNLRGRSSSQIFPLRPIGTASALQRPKTIGNIRKNGKSQSGNIYDSQGLAPTLCGIGNIKDPVKVGIKVMRKNQRENDRIYGLEGLSPTLNTMQGSQREPKIALPILSPDKLSKRQNGRRYKTNGEPMFTLTGQDRHGVILEKELNSEIIVLDDQGRKGKQAKMTNVVPTLRAQAHGNEPKVILPHTSRKLKVRNGSTNTPFLEAENGDNINLQLKARGTVKKGYTSAVLTSPDAVVQHLQIRKLTPLECFRLQSFPDWAFLRAATGQLWTEESATILAQTEGISNYLATLSKNERLTSDSQLYKQDGNSVTVNVIQEIARKLE